MRRVAALFLLSRRTTGTSIPAIVPPESGITRIFGNTTGGSRSGDADHCAGVLNGVRMVGRTVQCSRTAGSILGLLFGGMIRLRVDTGEAAIVTQAGAKDNPIGSKRQVPFTPKRTAGGRSGGTHSSHPASRVVCLSRPPP